MEPGSEWILSLVEGGFRWIPDSVNESCDFDTGSRLSNLESPSLWTSLPFGPTLDLRNRRWG